MTDMYADGVLSVILQVISDPDSIQGVMSSLSPVFHCECIHVPCENASTGQLVGD